MERPWMDEWFRRKMRQVESGSREVSSLVRVEQAVARQILLGLRESLTSAG
jgi:hypothetical protein